MENSAESLKPEEQVPSEEFKKALESSDEGVTVEIGGMYQYFKDKNALKEFLEELSNRDNR